MPDIINCIHIFQFLIQDTTMLLLCLTMNRWTLNKPQTWFTEYTNTYTLEVFFTIVKIPSQNGNIIYKYYYNMAFIYTIFSMMTVFLISTLNTLISMHKNLYVLRPQMITFIAMKNMNTDNSAKSFNFDW